MTRNVSQSNALYERAKAVIPGGIYGHYGYFVRDTGPKFFSKSNGSCFWDVDDNEYIDYMCAYGPMILGYNHPKVDEAALKQLKAGNTVSLASPQLVDLAETLIDMVTASDWALFGKNGGDSTALAAMVARAATGRRKLVKIKGGYHGVAAWMQAKSNPGMTPSDSLEVIEIPWNDIDALRLVIDQYPDDIAGFISSPYDHPVFADNSLPAENYWAQIESICREKGIVIIVDEVRTGFRIHLNGANNEYDFTPDLICFGKAIGNGYPLAALTGSDALKQAAQDVYFTGTQFFNAAPMAAAKATLLELQNIDGTNVMIDYGTRFKKGLSDIASSHGYNLKITGVPAMPYFRLTNADPQIHAEWIDQCVGHGAYMLANHNNFISTAHTEADMKRTFEIVDKAFKALGPPPPQSTNTA